MDFQSLVERKIEPVGSSNNDIIYRCPQPQCEGGDKGSGHLYVDYSKGYWHCFKCGIGGKRIESLLKLLKVDIDYDYGKLYSEQDKELDDIINPKRKVENAKVLDYSTDLKSLTDYFLLQSKVLSSDAINYLYERGITPSLIQKLGMREGVNLYGKVIDIDGKEFIGRDYSGRILIPSLRKDGLISFYVARDYTGTKEPKYLNPPKELAVASEDVYNLDMVDSDSIIICEGVFTCIAASPLKLNAVATYGKSIAQKSSSEDVRVKSQGEKLLEKKFKNYYVAYDADAKEEAIKTCKYLYDRGANVYFVPIDPKIYGEHADIADIGYEKFVELLKSSIRYDGGLSILL